MALNENHHTFIQAFMRRGPLEERVAKSMFQKLTESDEGFDDFMRQINIQLDFVQMEIRGAINQQSGKLHFALVNKQADEESKFGTRLNHAQILLFKAILEAIVLESSGEGNIPMQTALHLPLESQIAQGDTQAESSQAAAAKQLPLPQRSTTIEELIENKWLCRGRGNVVGLGDRTFIELRQYLKTMDVPTCNVCNEAAVKASLCPNGECRARMHLYCLKKKFNRPQIARVCPACHAPWRESDLQAVQGADEGTPSGRRNGSQRTSEG